MQAIQNTLNPIQPYDVYKIDIFIITKEKISLKIIGVFLNFEILSPFDLRLLTFFPLDFQCCNFYAFRLFFHSKALLRKILNLSCSRILISFQISHFKPMKNLDSRKVNENKTTRKNSENILPFIPLFHELFRLHRMILIINS